MVVISGGEEGEEMEGKKGKKERGEGGGKGEGDSTSIFAFASRCAFFSARRRSRCRVKEKKNNFK